MTKIKKAALVPYGAEEMFRLVEDVESYPQFLPWCESASILTRDDRQVTARLSVAKSGIRQSFTTRNTAEDRDRIHMQLVDGPFKRLIGLWTFDNIGGSGCRVGLELEFEFASRVLAYTFGMAFNKIATTLVDAFCERARAMHGEK